MFMQLLFLLLSPPCPSDDCAALSLLSSVSSLPDPSQSLNPIASTSYSGKQIMSTISYLFDKLIIV